MMLLFIGSLGIILIQILLFLLSGNYLFKKIIFLPSKKYPLSLKLSLSFFLGMGFLLSFWRIIDLIFKNAHLSYGITIILLLVNTYLNLRKKNILLELKILLKDIIDNKYLLFFLGIIVPLLMICYWVQPIDYFKAMREPFIFTGTSTGGRYGNIAKFIAEFGFIPTLGQNYGQAILSSIPLLFGVKAQLLNLFIWLVSTNIFLCTLAYGTFRYFGLKRNLSFLAMIISMFANTALSPVHYLVLDQLSPPFLLAYTDTIYAAGSYLVFIFFLMKYFLDKDNFRPAYFLAGFIFIISWCFTGAQNILITLFILLVLMTTSVIFFKKLKKGHPFKIFSLFILLIFPTLIGTFAGGLLTPKSLHTKAVISGTLSLNSFVEGLVNKRNDIKELDKLKLYNLEISQMGGGKDDDPNLEWPGTKVGMKKFKGKIVSGVVFFIPLLGFIFFGFYLLKKKENNLDKQIFWCVSLLVFVTGFSVAFYISQMKWPLTRFMIAGIYLSLIITAFSFLYFIQEYIKKDKMKHFAMILGTIILTFAPIFVIMTVLYQSYTHKQSFIDRLKIITSINEYIRGKPYFKTNIGFKTDLDIIKHDNIHYNSFMGKFDDLIKINSEFIRLKNNVDITKTLYAAKMAFILEKEISAIDLIKANESNDFKTLVHELKSNGHNEISMDLNEISFPNKGMQVCDLMKLTKNKTLFQCYFLSKIPNGLNESEKISAEYSLGLQLRTIVHYLRDYLGLYVSTSAR